MGDAVLKTHESKPLVAEKEDCAKELNRICGHIEASKIAGLPYSDPENLETFFEYFRRLFTITGHEENMREIKYGNGTLLTEIDKYFVNSPKKELDYGLKLARAYIHALFNKGHLSHR